MKNSGKLVLAVLMAAFALPVLADRDHNPPGPRGGPGASPDRHNRLAKHHRFLRGRMTNAEWLAFKALTLAERQAFCDRKKILRDDCWYDNDDNPPGPAGGPGTNWENPPGPAGGSGASPDRR